MFFMNISEDCKTITQYLTRSPAVAGWADRTTTTTYIRRPVPNVQSRKESDFSKRLQSDACYSDAVISNATTTAWIWYGNSAHMSDVCRQQHCIENCGQTAADRDMVTVLLTAYRNSSSYSMVPLPTPAMNHLATILCDSKVDNFCVIWKSSCDFLLVINSNFGPISHRFRDTDILAWHFLLKIAVNKMEIWLLLTAYKKSKAPYPMALSSTSYDLPFSHNAVRLQGR